MNLFDFKVFKGVAHLKSISLAAKELHMTQPAITHIINKLEKRYSLTLFDRSRQGTVLTENGKEFLVCVNQLLIEYENLENIAFQLKNKSLYKIVLATYPSVTVYCLAECIELGSFDQSKYVLAVREGSYQEVLEWMSTGNADFAISIKENLIPGFQYRFIGEDPYVLVSAKSVPSNLIAADLKKYPFIMPLSGCKEVLEPYLKQNEITINKVMESETISSTLALTLQINGITIVPLSGLNKQIINDFLIQPLEIKIQRQLIMQWSLKKENDPLFISFIDNLLTQLQKRKADSLR
ncbi:LysR family transcriptional regulator [Bacillus gaemokensis]|uniref:HTH-type transcriptional regulator CzcR n=1 Tax=Bacillus gaemokensis TaxID=574375 RepID=A0A073KP04_9BACI|nr:LysR family transcriptional regulator [Bacillus gaemokensis]KEK24098.1 LysR family transcriptional regulator [Bacillus gaemokensis]KYG32756.1 LysR family transcriptional regulator [Bacillus gaemokensis]